MTRTQHEAWLKSKAQYDLRYLTVSILACFHLFNCPPDGAAWKNNSTSIKPRDLSYYSRMSTYLIFRTLDLGALQDF